MFDVLRRPPQTHNSGLRKLTEFCQRKLVEFCPRKLAEFCPRKLTEFVTRKLTEFGPRKLTNLARENYACASLVNSQTKRMHNFRAVFALVVVFAQVFAGFRGSSPRGIG